MPAHDEFGLIVDVSVDQTHVVDDDHDGRGAQVECERAGRERIMNATHGTRLADRTVERHAEFGRQVGSSGARTENLFSCMKWTCCEKNNRQESRNQEKS
jgi:hypothetical protein